MQLDGGRVEYIFTFFCKKIKLYIYSEILVCNNGEICICIIAEPIDAGY